MVTNNGWGLPAERPLNEHSADGFGRSQVNQIDSSPDSRMLA